MLKLGTHKSVKELSGALASSGFQISYWAADILKKVDLLGAETEVDLVNVSVGEMGLEAGPALEQIYARARELGLDLVPAEAGPQLRLQYTDQPMDEWLLLAMEPVTDSDGNLDVFSLQRNEDGLWLYVDCVAPKVVWSPEYRWVFARRREK